jgi:peptide/nickel transport system permease protein
LGEDYIRTAAAKGLSQRTVVYKHAFRNALLPVITLVGLYLPALLTGAYFVEIVFSIPGMGYLGLNAIFERDYPTVMAITLFSAAMVVAGNLLADVAYAAADPRIRYD